MMKILVITIHSTLSPISAYYHYFHSLLTAPTNAPLQHTVSRTLKKDNYQLGSNAVQLDSPNDTLLNWYLEETIGIN